VFDIGPEKLLIILGLALIVLGPGKLPEMAKSMGKGLRDFRKAQSDIREELVGHLNETNGSEPTPDAGVKVPEETHQEGQGKG
jgi:TatA/E family protein of Tat protein translocase